MRYRVALLGCVMGLGAVYAHADDRFSPVASASALSSASALRLPRFSALSAGLSIDGDAQSVVMPLNGDNTWAVGIANLDAREGLDGSPGHGFHLNGAPTPGAILQHRF